jgi:hypothetical protein
LRHDEAAVVVVEQEAAEVATEAADGVQKVAWPQPWGQLLSDGPSVGSRGGSIS